MAEPLESKKETRGKTALATWAFFAQARRRANLTQEELAERCGLWQNQISRWERGESPPDFRHVAKLAQALGIDAGEFAQEIVKYFSGDTTNNGKIPRTVL